MERMNQTINTKEKEDQKMIKMVGLTGAMNAGKHTCLHLL
jgi:hypothetical protein